MPVLLRTSGAIPPRGDWEYWTASWGTEARLDPADRVRGEAEALERAFDAASEEWYALARQMDGQATSWLGHAPSVAPNASDLGLMLAWDRVVRDWAGGSERVLVLCDDPWLFRHLAGINGVSAGRAPGLALASARFWLRGLVSRTAVALRVVRACLLLRRQRAQARHARPALLVYGHPGSNADGQDAYFGPLMRVIPNLGRALHVDCMADRARVLARDGRTYSLHAFGAPGFALLLPWMRWRVPAGLRHGAFGWLLRRSEAREGATGSAAMVRWQIHCQNRWIDECHPSIVAWPWENHGWERALMLRLRAAGAVSLGYQHSVIGAQRNISARGLADPVKGLPDMIVANGPSGEEQLRRTGIPAERLRIGGTLRFKPQHAAPYHQDGPVFLAVPFDRLVAAQMVEAARPLIRKGFVFLVKDHPLHPFSFREEPGLTRTTIQLENQIGVRAVVFAATTVGLEAALAGLPAIRFLPRGCIALDILPKEVRLPVAGPEDLGECLARIQAPETVAWDSIFALPDLDLWQRLLGHEN